MNIDEELDDFNKGPTDGTLNDKRRMALIYEELLHIRGLLQRGIPQNGNVFVGNYTDTAGSGDKSGTGTH